jgi:hypothetical protein
MKDSKLPVLLLGAALLLSSGVFAAEANKGTLQLSDKVTVEGKPLNSGKYTVEWNGAGPAVQVTILQGKQTVATFSAHLTEQPTPNSDDAYGTTTGADGSRALTAFYPAHKRFALVVDQNGSASQQPTPTPSSR